MRTLRTRRTLVTASAVLAASTGITLTLSASGASAKPPDPPSKSTAQQYLSELTEKAEGSMSGYDRDKFPHWISQGDNCNTREVVLKRDGEGVQTGDDCYPTSGTWYSVYDGETEKKASDVQIDHMVPLAEAWRSGAKDWSQDKREKFANDLDAQQLIAVSGPSNNEKSDHDPADWVPSRKSYQCEYARSWVSVKHKWKLDVDKDEKAAVKELLDAC